jgi:hypothetical protein
MPEFICRENLNSLLPNGSIFCPMQDGDFDLFLDGLSENTEDIKDFLLQLSDLRNPALTPLLIELEQEYGLYNQNTLSNLTRRQKLLSKMFAQDQPGTSMAVQNALWIAGFTNVYIYQNSPASNPSSFTTQDFQCVCGDPLNSFAGDPGAYAGQTGGILLVNGKNYTQSPHYLSVCGNNINGFANDPNMVCGWYDELNQDLITYDPPTDPGVWPLCFFVCGQNIVRDINGFIITAPFVNIDNNRKDEFETIILSYKPIHAWAIMIINYI